MQGSIEKPPIVIRSSKRACLIGFAICAGFILFRCYVFWQTGWPLQFGPYIWPALAGAWALLFVLLYLLPATLEISPQGLAYRGSIGRRMRWRWAEIDNFRAKEFGFVSFESISGDGALGPCWEGGAAQVADILNKARSRWVPPDVDQ
jgi:hypothetical protein